MTAARALDMVDPTQDTSWISTLSNSGGSMGIVIATCVTGFLALRKWLSNESVNTAANAAQTELINLLRQQIETERARADKAETARDLAIQQISALKEQVDTLTDQVQALRKQLKNGEISKPGAAST